MIFKGLIIILYPKLITQLKAKSKILIFVVNLWSEIMVGQMKDYSSVYYFN